MLDPAPRSVPGALLVLEALRQINIIQMKMVDLGVRLPRAWHTLRGTATAHNQPHENGRARPWSCAHRVPSALLEALRHVRTN